MDLKSPFKGVRQVHVLAQYRDETCFFAKTSRICHEMVWNVIMITTALISGEHYIESTLTTPRETSVSKSCIRILYEFRGSKRFHVYFLNRDSVVFPHLIEIVRIFLRLVRGHHTRRKYSDKLCSF